MRTAITVSIAYLILALVGGVIWTANRYLAVVDEKPVRVAISALKAGNYADARKSLVILAWDEHWLAAEVLGDVYALGLGVEIDPVAARVWYRRSECRCINPGANELDIAFDYLNRDSTNLEKNAAVEWLERAAEAGNFRAQRILAGSSDKGFAEVPVQNETRTYWRRFVSDARIEAGQSG